MRLAYEEYRRIHREQGNNKPRWERVPHAERLAWEAAIQGLREFEAERSANKEMTANV